VLVVDDETDVRDSIDEFLQDNNYAVCEAGDGEEALAKTFTEKPEQAISKTSRASIPHMNHPTTQILSLIHLIQTPIN